MATTLTTVLYGVVHANPAHPEYLEYLLEGLIGFSAIVAVAGIWIPDKPKP